MWNHVRPVGPQGAGGRHEVVALVQVHYGVVEVLRIEDAEDLGDLHGGIDHPTLDLK